MRVLLAGVLAATYAFAQQSAPVYEDARVRISNVPPRGDYIWVALDGGAIQFSRGAVIQTRGSITIELLQKQTNPRNVCGEVLKGQYLHCHEPGSEWLGANLQIQFETDQARFGILEIAPGARLLIPPADVPPLLIALQGTEAEAVSRANGTPPSSGSQRSLRPANVLRSPADQVTEIRNTGKSAARFLVVEFGGPGE